mgnify:CR=1 FL=1
MKLQASLKKEYQSLKEQIEYLWEQNQLGDPKIADFSKVKVEIHLQAFGLPVNVGKKQIGSMHFDPVVVKTTGDFVDQTMSLALQAPYFQTREPIVVRMTMKAGKNDYVFEGKYSFSKSSVRKTKAFKQL